ncbi:MULTISPECIES: Hint domain-containing protein [Falsihalocynthiibacter]|uniref:Hint domain-containing protein n=1 Tax=Falsihalocynthiibacter TaxID=2854182 RepID=UPI0030024FBB
MVDTSLPYDEQTSPDTVIDPDSNNPITVVQTSQLQTTDNGDVGQDGFDLSVNLTGANVTEQVNIAIAIDTSGSTSGSSGTDFDGDGRNETILQAEIFAAQELFDAYVDAGYDPSEISITLITYASGARVVGTYTLNDSAAFTDALSSIGSAGSNGQTNYVAGLNAVGDAWTAEGVDPADTNVLVFLSDGEAYPGGQNISGAASNLENGFNTQISGIGVGRNSSLDDLNQLDNTSGADQVLSGEELLAIIVEPLTDADFLRFEVTVEGLDANGDPFTQVLIFNEGDPEVTSTQLGWSIGNYTLDPAFQSPQDITVTVEAYFAEDPSNPGSGEQVVTTVHEIALVICFTPGTMILTPTGEVAIETLVAGNRVVTRDHGVQEVRWVGATELPPVHMDLNKNLRPVLIKQGALGKDLPSQDLRVSRQHRILVRDWRAEMMFGSEEGVLVPAFTLCNDSTIIQERPTAPVTYIHMAFDNHEIVYADGIEAESFHPSERMVSGMADDEARKELYTLFPHLENSQDHAYDSARNQVRAREAAVVRQA